MDSGGTRFVFDQIEIMQRLYGHHFTIFCDVVSPDSRKLAEQIGVPLVTLDSASTNSPWYWITLAPRVAMKRRRLRRDIGSYDIAITSMFPMNWIIERLRIPKVQICYEPFAFFYDQRFRSSLRAHERLFFAFAAKLYARFDRRSTRSIDRTITVNETNVAKIVATYGVDAHVVYAGVETSKFSKIRSDDVLAIRSHHGTHPLLFHSTDLSGTKGTIPFLSIFKRLLATFPSARLLITVYVQNAARLRELRQRIAKMDLDDSVEILGCLPEKSYRFTTTPSTSFANPVSTSPQVGRCANLSCVERRSSAACRAKKSWKALTAAASTLRMWMRAWRDSKHFFELVAR